MEINYIFLVSISILILIVLIIFYLQWRKYDKKEDEDGTNEEDTKRKKKWHMGSLLVSSLISIPIVLLFKDQLPKIISEWKSVPVISAIVNIIQFAVEKSEKKIPVFSSMWVKVISISIIVLFVFSILILAIYNPESLKVIFESKKNQS